MKVLAKDAWRPVVPTNAIGPYELIWQGLIGPGYMTCQKHVTLTRGHANFR